MRNMCSYVSFPALIQENSPIRICEERAVSDRLGLRW